MTKKTGFWLSEVTSDTLMPNLPKVFKGPSIYGINAEIVNSNDGYAGNLTERNDDNNYLKITFFNKKLNSAKYIHRLREDLPELLPATLNIDVHRFPIYKEGFRWGTTFPNVDRALVGYALNKKKEPITKEVDGITLHKYSIKVVDRFKKDRYKRFKYSECLRFTIVYPLMFSTDFTKVYYKAIDFRNLVKKLLAKYKADDDLNKLYERPVTPEYNQSEITKLTSEATHDGYLNYDSKGEVKDSVRVKDGALWA